MDRLPTYLTLLLIILCGLIVNLPLFGQSDTLKIELGDHDFARLTAVVIDKVSGEHRPINWDNENHLSDPANSQLVLKLNLPAENNTYGEVFFSFKSFKGIKPIYPDHLPDRQALRKNEWRPFEFAIQKAEVSFLISFNNNKGHIIGQFEKQLYFEVVLANYPNTSGGNEVNNDNRPTTTSAPDPSFEEEDRKRQEEEKAGKKEEEDKNKSHIGGSLNEGSGNGHIDISGNPGEAVGNPNAEKPAAPDTTVDSLTAQMDDELIDEVKGRVIEFFPDTMYTQTTYRVIVEVTSDTSVEVVQREIQSDPRLRENPDEVRSYLIDGLGTEMKARLLDTSPEDDKNFRIVPIFENSIRPIDFLQGRPSRWEWDVYPLQKGEHQLSLVLERVVSKEKGDYYPILDKKIIVLVQKSPVYLFIYSGIALLVIGLSGFFWWRKKRRLPADLAFHLSDYENIMALIASSQTEEALASLQKQGVPEKYNSQIVILLSRLNRNAEKTRMGISDEATLEIERNKVNADLLKLVNEMKKAAT